MSDVSVAGPPPMADANRESRHEASIDRGDRSRIRRSASLRQRALTRTKKFFGSAAWLHGQSAKQFMSTVRSTYRSLRPALADNALLAPIVQELDTTLTPYDGPDVEWGNAQTWDDAYKCERLMVGLLDARRLDMELSRRIEEARNEKLPLAQFYAGRVRTAADPATALTEAQVEDNRILLARLLDDLQWHYNQLFQRRGYAHAVQKRVSLVFVIALLIFGGTMLWTFRLAEQKAEDQQQKVEQSANDGETSAPVPAPGITAVAPAAPDTPSEPAVPAPAGPDTAAEPQPPPDAPAATPGDSQ